MSKKYNKDYFKKLREESSKSYYDVPALNWGSMVDGKYTVQNRYEFKWKTVVGDKKTLTPLDMNLHDYIKKFQYDNEMAGRSVSASVGCDSQNHTSYSRFVLVVALRVSGNGVHIIVHRMDLPKIYDYRYRLLKETDVSAEFVRNNKDFFEEINMPLEVHADYNGNENKKSNGVVSEATNFVKTHGFNLKIKTPNECTSFTASYAADHWC